MREDQDIRLIALRPSRLLIAAFSLASAITLAGIVVLSDSAVLSLSLCTGMVVILIGTMRRLLFRTPRSIIGFALYEARESSEKISKILLKQQNGRLIEAKIMPHSFVTSWMVCIKYQSCDRKWLQYFSRTLLIMTDSLDPEAFRRTRVYLKWG